MFLLILDYGGLPAWTIAVVVVAAAGGGILLLVAAYKLCLKQAGMYWNANSSVIFLILSTAVGFV